jgi:hypothetical protein
MGQILDPVIKHIERVKAKFGSTDRKFASTLDADSISSYIRRAGNTTRQIDYAIQELFKGKIVIVHDHYQAGEHRPMNEYLFRRILSRLQFEHQDKDKIVFDKQDLIIYLK